MHSPPPQDNEMEHPSSKDPKMATSMKVFRKHLLTLQDGSIVATGIISPDCYNDWLNSRNLKPCPIEAKRYYRTLTAHVTGVDGRTPFTPVEECAVLKVIR